MPVEESVIKADRVVRQALIDCILVFLLIPATGLYLWVVLPSLFQSNRLIGTSNSSGIAIIIPVIYALVMVEYYVKVRGLAKKRAQALGGQWQAQIVVVPGQEPLEGPTTIVVDSRPRYIFWNVLWLLIFGVLPVMLEYWLISVIWDQYNATVTDPAFAVTVSISPIFWVILGVLVALLFGAFFLYQHRMVTQLEVAPTGLTSRYQGKEDSLFWEEMRVFARYTLGRRRNSMVVYEITGLDASGNTVVVRWKWGRHRMLNVVHPVLTPAEYDAVPARLIALIQEKTHLPLLDFEAGTAAVRTA